jgi:hypothetical protein
MSEQRIVPGIYVNDQQYSMNPLHINTRVLSAFVGISERGPLHTPILIKSFDEYMKTFGAFDTAGNLPLSVYSYFKCGGSECIIVRAANEKHAKKARIQIPCGNGHVIFEALSEGVWGNNIQIRIWHEGERGKETSASISLSYKEKSEHFLHLSMNPSSDRYFVSYINDRSHLCKVQSNAVQGMIGTAFSLHASGGSEGIAEMSAGDFIGHYKGPNDYRGLGALESRDDISLIAVPDISWLLSLAGKPMNEKENDVYAAQQAMVNQAEKFRGRFAILDVPETFKDAEALAWSKHFDTHSAAAYYPSIDVLDPLHPSGIKTLRIPPSGAVCGCISESDNEKGIFHAPANCLLHGAVGLSEKIDASAYELLYPAGINLLKYFPGRGIKIWGARTLSSDPDWRYINVRRTFSAICKSIKQGTQWAVFEPNDMFLRKRLVRQVSGFLLDLWMKGYLAGAVPEQAFYVRCDEELNPPEQVDKGILSFEAGLAISKPTEFFNIFITAEKEGASVYLEEVTHG